MLPDRIKLMSGLRAMEVESAIAIIMVKRNTIGIIVISKHGKNAAGLFL